MQKFRVLSSKKQRKADKLIRVLFTTDTYERMRSAFAGFEASARESYAMAQCGYKVDGSRKNWTYMVRSLHVPAREDLVEQSSITVTPRAEFIEAILCEAAGKNNAVLELHAHVGSAAPNFSWVDIENGLENGRFLRSCGLRFAMVLVGSGGFSMCEYDADYDALQTPESARISVAGRAGIKDVVVRRSVSSCELPARAGPEGMHVAVMGLDGVGFGIACMLAHAGVKKFTLYDDGVAGEDGPGVKPYSAEKGKKRTRVAHNMLKKISGDVVVAHVSDARNVKNALKECDAIFVCDDDEAVRAAANEASLKYFIPCIEARVIEKKDGTGQYGRVSIFVPSVTGCMGCFTDERQETPAAVDASRIAVDSMVASMAVQEFMDMVPGCEAGHKTYDHVEYDPSTHAVSQKVAGRDCACPMCGKGGVLGAGDERKAAANAVKN